MNRRAFLAWIGGTAAGVAAAPYLDLDKLLWIPGEKKILLPAVEVYSGPDWLSVEWMIEEGKSLIRESVLTDTSFVRGLEVGPDGHWRQPVRVERRTGSQFYKYNGRAR